MRFRHTKLLLGLASTLLCCSLLAPGGTRGQDDRAAQELEHAATYPLEGSHAGLECVTCHPLDDPVYSEAALRMRAPRAPRDCWDCHEPKHTEGWYAVYESEIRMRSQGMVEQACETCHDHAEWIPGRFFHARKRRVCELCHKVQDPTFSDAKQRMIRPLHDGSGFSLRGPHWELECEKCHPPHEDVLDEELRWKTRFPGRKPLECNSCHESPHRGQFEKYTLPGDEKIDCNRCHPQEGFVPVGFDQDKHAETAFPLVDTHLAVACRSCHPEHADGPDYSRQFKDLDKGCAGCHEDPHGGRFDEPHLPVEVEGRTTCERCHQPTAFADLRGPDFEFDHTYWTGHELVGPHAAAECTACHERTRLPDELGRSFGRIADVFGPEAQRCENCHEDPHYGLWDLPGRPQEVWGRVSCERCHEPTTFAELRGPFFEFDHDLWTASQVESLHGELECEKCHPKLPEKDARGRTFEPAKGARCASCHEDPHVGQFLEGGWIACERCHQPGGKFVDLVFDHALDARFDPGEQHAEIECEKCHQPWPVSVEGGPPTRFKPLGIMCESCHLPGGVERGGR